jgi:hypothetical protein
MKKLAPVALLVAACAPTQFAPGADKDPAAFEVDSAKCRMTAKAVTPGITAFGPPLLIAAAASRHNQDLKEEFNDCMVVSGWHVVKE